FAAMIPWRLQRLRDAARQFFGAAGGEQRALFEAFCSGHASWLDDYALFMALAEAHPDSDWCDWEEPLAQRQPAALARAREAPAGQIDFHRFCQWRFHEQWSRLRRHANERGVQIVGDAPIYVAYHSAEVWARPELFDLDKARRPSHVAGVPPDYFSATGQ